MAVLKQALNIKLCLIAIVFVSSLLMAVPGYSYAWSASAQEYSVKAAFVYNFVKFIEWPESSLAEDNAVLNLCVMEESPLGKAMETMQGNIVKGRKIVVNYINKANDSARCQVFFIGSNEKKHMKAMLSKVSGNNVLTVGEFEGFARHGGIINFFIVNDKILFEINIDAAKRSGLTISSQLLKLSEIVREK